MRFPEFKDSFEITSIGKLLKVKMGQSPDSSSYNDDGIGVPLVQGNADIKNRITKPQRYTSSPSSKFCEIDDTLISVRAPVGSISKSNVHACIGRGIASLGNLDNFIYQFFLLKETSWDKIAQGSTFTCITAKDIENLTIGIPSLEERIKIGNFLTLLDKRISTQNKIIRDLKVLIKRFLDFDYKTSTSNYKNVLLSSILTESKILNSNNNDIYSVAVEDGVVNQVEHLGRSFAAKDTSNYHVAKYGDIIYTKSPTGSFPYGIVKQSFVQNDVAVSPLYGIYHPNSYEIGYYIHHYFLYAINCNNYLHPLVNKGAKNTMNITNTRFLEGKILVPKNIDRVNSIFKFLNAINKKLNNEIKINNKLLEQKNFLLKNLFI